MSDNIDFGPMMEPVARELLGDPNPAMSKPGVELRWGNHGSMSVDLVKHTWFDHSAEEGGGVLALLARDMGLSTPEAMSWLKEKGFDIPDQQDSNQSPQKRRIIETYDYLDIAGDLVFQVCRWEPKTFTQRRPLGDEPGVWINGMRAGKFMRRNKGDDYWRYDENRSEKFNNKDIMEFPACDQMPVYRLPEILDAIAQGQRVFFVEGEKDANNLWKAGIPATTVAGGSKKWQKHYANYFKGAHVVLCPDNDVTGRQHIENVGARLRGIATTSVILDISKIWSDAPEKADVSDWQSAGNDLDELHDLVDTHAVEWKPGNPPSKFRAITFDQLDKVGEEHEYLVHNLITRKELILLYGASGSGKSFVALDISLSISRGVEYRGLRALRGGIVYQAGEGGIGIKKRVRAYRDFYMDKEERPPPFVMLPARIDLFSQEGSTGDLITEINAWKSTFDCPLELVVIDTLATATPGANENASTDMSTVLKNCERIQHECDCAVMLVHHKNANGDKPRGHTSIYANIENALECQTTERVDTEEREDGSILNRPIRRLFVAKNKDGEAGSGFDFILRQVKMGENKHGEAITSCVCAPPMAQSDADASPRRHLTDQQFNAMQALKDALAEHGEATPDVLKLPRSIRNVVLYRHWRLAYTALTEGEDDPDDEKVRSRVKKAIERVGAVFLRSRYIGRANQYIWLTGKPVPGFAGSEETTAPTTKNDQQYNSDIMDGGINW